MVRRHSPAVGAQHRAVPDPTRQYDRPQRHGRVGLQQRRYSRPHHLFAGKRHHAATSNRPVALLPCGEHQPRRLRHECGRATGGTPRRGTIPVRPPPPDIRSRHRRQLREPPVFRTSTNDAPLPFHPGHTLPLSHPDRRRTDVADRRRTRRGTPGGTVVRHPRRHRRPCRRDYSRRGGPRDTKCERSVRHHPLPPGTPLSHRRGLDVSRPPGIQHGAVHPSARRGYRPLLVQERATGALCHRRLFIRDMAGRRQRPQQRPGHVGVTPLAASA